MEGLDNTTDIQTDQINTDPNIHNPNVDDVSNDANLPGSSDLTTDDTPDPNPSVAINDELVLSYLKEKGVEVESFEELSKPKIEKIEVDPYKDIMDEETKNWLDFRKNTGRSKKEYEYVIKDIDAIPAIELAREKVRKESGMSKLENDAIDTYIQNKLGIDLSDMDSADEIELNKYVKSIRDEYRSLQEIYKKPIEQPKPTNLESEEKLIELADGRRIPESQYNKLKEQYDNYVKSNQASVNSVTEADFKVSIDLDGNPREVSYKYEFDDKDKHSMLSLTNDTSNFIKRYQKEDGTIDQVQMNKDAFWLVEENRQKAIASIVQKAIAENTELILKQRGNVNYTHSSPAPEPNVKGVRYVPLSDVLNN